MSHHAELSGPACRPMQEQTQATKPSSHGPEVWFIWLTISAIRRKVRRIFLQSRATPQSESLTMSGWRFAGLFAYYIVLSALAVIFAAAFATAPYWLWPA